MRLRQLLKAASLTADGKDIKAKKTIDPGG